jgi:two-component system NarL family sensor kinase
MDRHLQASERLLRRESVRGSNKSSCPSATIFAADQLSLAELTDELLKIHEYERERLGQELHDSAGQLLVSLQLSIARLQDIEKNNGHGLLMAEIQDTLRQIDQEIRALSFLHHPAELGQDGLCSAVGSLARGFGRRTGISTNFKCLGTQSGIADSISTAMLRIAQEALVNVHRHSHATTAQVVLENRGDSIRLTVADDGIGISGLECVAETQGIGLQGMRHRIEMLHGRFQIRRLKRGTKITASVPIAA